MDDRQPRPRRLRPRPLEDSNAADAPPSMDTTAPRLGLAFILNDAAAREPRALQLPLPRDRASRPDVLPSIASLELPLPLPPRRVGLWATPTPLPVAGVASLRLRPPEEAKPEEIKPASTQEMKQEEEKVEEKRAADESPAAAALSREEKRRGRTCRIDGCDNYIVHKGLCCRHGGARKCSTEGCDSTAKYMGLCWKHGGSTWCKVEGCSKRAKAKGRCWAHGGGTKCGHPGCTKVAVSNGLCWAHGGGKRCLFDGCNRPGYERTNGFCDRHHDEVQQVNYFEV